MILMLFVQCDCLL